MTTIETNTLIQLLPNERSHNLTVLLLTESNSLMARYLLTRKRSNFFDIEGVLLWVCECQHYSSSLYTHKEKMFDKIPIYCQYSIDSVDPICRETYPFATEIACDSNPDNIIALNSDGKE